MSTATIGKTKFDLDDAKQREAYWTTLAANQLLGKKIVRVRYLSEAEANEMGWSSRPVVLQLDDGNIIYAAADDEGNDGGALFTNNEKVSILPVLS